MKSTLELQRKSLKLCNGMQEVLPVVGCVVGDGRPRALWLPPEWPLPPGPYGSSSRTPTATADGKPDTHDEEEAGVQAVRVVGVKWELPSVELLVPSDDINIL